MQIAGKQNEGEKGAALVEAAIMMPLVFMLITMCFDIGSALTSTLRIQDFARQGLMRLSSELNLETGNFSSNATVCRVAAGPVIPCGAMAAHRNVQLEVRRMILNSIDVAVDPNSINVQTRLNTVTTATGIFDEVSIRITARYAGLFYPFNGLEITLADMGPRL